jgi:uroporphyrinogen-III synthase
MLRIKAKEASIQEDHILLQTTGAFERENDLLTQDTRLFAITAMAIIFLSGMTVILFYSMIKTTFF